MKKTRKTLSIILTIVLLLSLCACGTKTTEKTPEYEARRAVESYASFTMSSIGGNGIKNINATITNMQQISETEYVVNGSAVATDVYGVKWSNYFDCNVEQEEDGSWDVNNFHYQSDSWKKQ